MDVARKPRSSQIYKRPHFAKASRGKQNGHRNIPCSCFTQNGKNSRTGNFVRALGHDLPIKNGRVDAKDINILLKQIEGHASESLIKTAAIRSMAKAVYSTKKYRPFRFGF